MATQYRPRRTTSIVAMVLVCVFTLSKLYYIYYLYQIYLYTFVGPLIGWKIGPLPYFYDIGAFNIWAF